MNQAKHQKRQRLFRAFYICLWILLLPILLECYARLIHYRGMKASAVDSEKLELRQVREAFHPDLWQVPWKAYSPNSSVIFSTDTTEYKVNINSWGFRGEEFEYESSSDFVIACIGGSTTVNGMTDDATYPALLEQFLRYGDRQVVTINCGISGLGSVDYMLPISTLLQNIQPNIVVEYNAVNDICWYFFSLWNDRLNPIQRVLLRSYFVRYFCGDFFLPDCNTIRNDIREFTIKNLKSTATLLNKHGVNLYVCSFIYPNIDSASNKEYNYLDHNLRYWWRSNHVSYKRYCEIVDIYNEELKAAFHGSKVTYLPLAESYTFSPDEFVDICHMKSSGIRRKAQALANLLVQTKDFPFEIIPKVFGTK